jgi:hypothetical protein
MLKNINVNKGLNHLLEKYELNGHKSRSPYKKNKSPEKEFNQTYFVKKHSD